MCLFIDITL